MSFSDPVEVIDHIPSNFDMKRKTPKRPLDQRKNAKKARRSDEPFSCERPSPIWKVVVLVGALAVSAGALIQGVFR